MPVLKKAIVPAFLLLFASCALAADFYVVSISFLEPASDGSSLVPLKLVEEGHTALIVIQVNVKNQGDVGICYLDLRVFDQEGTELYSLPIQSLRIRGNESRNAQLGIPPDTISSWSAGNYTVTVKACPDAVCSTVHDRRTRTLTVRPVQRQLVPETSVVLLPLIALSVLALLFFTAGGRG